MKKCCIAIVSVILLVLIVRPTLPCLFTPQRIELVDHSGKREEITGSDKEAITELLRGNIFIERQILRWFMTKTDWKFPDYARSEYLEITTAFGFRYRIYWWYEMGLLLECSLTKTYAHIQGSSETKLQEVLEKHGFHSQE